MSASIESVGGARQNADKMKGKIGARPIHVLLRGGAGQGLAGRDDEGHDTTSQG